MAFKDHFSQDSGGYRRFRPTYPAALFDYLAGLTPSRRLAWDCATGSGQTAVALRRHFTRVVASDASTQQIEQAQPADGIDYRVAAAEAIDLPDGAVDLVCVSQALHWFDIPAFFAEAARVLRPGGVLAIWSYNLLTINPQIDRQINQLYNETVGQDWPPERRLIERGYRDIQLPFDELQCPALQMLADWSLPQLCGYLRTWSAVHRYWARTGEDPVIPLQQQLQRLWGEPDRQQRVSWPLALRVCCKDR